MRSTAEMEASTSVVRNLSEQMADAQIQCGDEEDEDVEEERVLLTGEDDVELQRRGVERLMLKSPAFKQQLAGRNVMDFRPMLVWDNQPKIIPVKSAFMSEKDWRLLGLLDAGYMAELPLWSLNLTAGGLYKDDGGSCFPVSPAFVEGEAMILLFSFLQEKETFSAETAHALVPDVLFRVSTLVLPEHGAPSYLTPLLELSLVNPCSFQNVFILFSQISSDLPRSA